MKGVLVILFALGTVLLPLSAGSLKEGASDNRQLSAASLKPGDQLSITGRIRVKGSEPFTIIVLETADGGNYELVGEMAGTLRRQFELKMVTLAGVVLNTGDGLRPPLVEVSSFRAAERT